jgi:hypothetical protein
MTVWTLLWCGQVHRGRVSDLAASRMDLQLATEGLARLGATLSTTFAFMSEEDARPNDFECDVYEAVPSELRKVCARIAESIAPGDAVVFVATNHGSTQGLLTSSTPDEYGDHAGEDLLTPACLEECLDLLQAPQLVTIAACHAGTFEPLGKAGSRAVFVGCGQAERLYIESGDRPNSPELAAFFGALCGVSIDGRPVPPRCDVAGATDVALSIGRTLRPPTTPALHGSSPWPPLLRE